MTSRFERRVDETPIREVTTRDLVRRIARLDAELGQLAADELHVDTHTFGRETIRHLRKISEERTAAVAKKTGYVQEIESRRTPHDGEEKESR